MPTRFIDVIAWGVQRDAEPVYGYWDLCALIADLAHGDAPLIEGLPAGPFDLALHDDAERHRRYIESALTVTPLAVALLERRDDYAPHATIDRWWGGTHLTNDALWRWDAANGMLVAPGDRGQIGSRPAQG